MHLTFCKQALILSRSETLDHLPVQIACVFATVKAIRTPIYFNVYVRKHPYDKNIFLVDVHTIPFGIVYINWPSYQRKYD